jgi:hypothetical protein
MTTFDHVIIWPRNSTYLFLATGLCMTVIWWPDVSLYFIFENLNLNFYPYF